MTTSRPVIAALIIIACGLLNPVLVSDPVAHVLIQLPLLAWAGSLLVSPGKFADAPFNGGGWAALLLAIFAIAFWMLPRSIDAALTSPVVNIAKFVSLPVCVGAAIAIGWQNAHPILRGFIKAQTISMLLVMSFLYTHSPVRICNAYLVNDQERLGYGFLYVACCLVAIWCAPLFFPNGIGLKLRVNRATSA